MGDERTRENYLACLKRGAEHWNAFRRDFAGSLVLNCAALAGAQLARAELHGVLFMESNFRGANLQAANLERAILRNADLRGSDLGNAILDSADLFRADLSGADLRGTSLASAFLRRTDLSGADLSTARGLTGDQINQAIGDEHTILPPDVARPASWPQTVALTRAAG